MLNRSAKSLEEFCGYYPTLATIVTAKSNGRENAMAVAWHVIVSTNPPAYGVSVSPKRFTHGLITESGRFAVNFLPAEETELIAAVGGCSGRDVDKFKEFGIEKAAPAVIDVPVLKRAYFALECEVASRTSCGDHDWFIGRIVAAHWSEEAFDEEGLVRFEKARPTAYMGGNRYLAILRGEPTHFDRKECIARRREAVARNAT